MWAVVGVAMLGCPLLHVTFGHSSLRRVLGRYMRMGVPVPSTQHELNHRERSRPVRAAATLFWAVWLVAALVLTTAACHVPCSGHGGTKYELGGWYYCADGTREYG
jgi:hypothetical protein